MFHTTSLKPELKRPATLLPLAVFAIAMTSLAARQSAAQSTMRIVAVTDAAPAVGEQDFYLCANLATGDEAYQTTYQSSGQVGSSGEDISDALSAAVMADTPLVRPQPVEAVTPEPTLAEATSQPPAATIDTAYTAQNNTNGAAAASIPAPAPMQTAPVVHANEVEPGKVPTGTFGVLRECEQETCHCFGGTPMCDCPYCPGQSGTPVVWGVDCGGRGSSCCATWHNAYPIPWSMFGPGEYVGPPRPEHVPTYYLRVNDLITLTFINSRRKNTEPYKLAPGDRLRVESKSDDTLDREVVVQPDGTISLPLIGEVEVAGKTIDELRTGLHERYGKIEQNPLITVTPMETNLALVEIIKAVTSQTGNSGQALDLKVTPDGTIQPPGLGSVYVQGLTLEELRSELESRYAAAFGPGLLLSPSLTQRATTYVFVGGEVRKPDRYTLEGPTTVMQAIQMAGGWNNGGALRQVVVFRRDENWCLKATKINVHRPLYGKDPCPTDDVWLRDNDLVIVPKSPILCATDVVNLYFTRGVYAVFPITFVKDFSTGTAVVPVGP
jgi:polysaccharide export outer membrane protein